MTLSVRLDRALFRRLIWLYVLSLPITIVAIVYETLSPAWIDFSDEFDLLVEYHFGPISDRSMIILGIVLLIGLTWHIVAIYGLLRFKGWARWGFWASLLLVLPIGVLPGMNGPTYSGPWVMIPECAGSMLYGAVLLVAYAEGLGSSWFTPLSQEADAGSVDMDQQRR